MNYCIAWIQVTGETPRGKGLVMLASGTVLLGIYTLVVAPILIPIFANIVLAIILMRADKKHTEELLDISWFLCKHSLAMFLFYLIVGTEIARVLVGGKPGDQHFEALITSILVIPFSFIVTTGTLSLAALVGKLILIHRPPTR